MPRHNRTASMFRMFSIRFDIARTRYFGREEPKPGRVVSFDLFVDRGFFRIRSGDFVETAALLKGLTSLALLRLTLNYVRIACLSFLNGTSITGPLPKEWSAMSNLGYM